MVGVLVYAVIIGSVPAALAMLNSKQTEHNEKLDLIISIMRSQVIPQKDWGKEDKYFT